ncbi:12600_t:CDS:2 [Acaulospora colombiana]|uniref:12600_t:CDS:1 n=1 Tax=Acaulospora colombiana TaxID=27376 RepID=A0ACA9LJW1_9GLOM|nr:12600_t:CDS:2 [Acaulospora colombiana]
MEARVAMVNEDTGGEVIKGALMCDVGPASSPSFTTRRGFIVQLGHFSPDRRRYSGLQIKQGSKMLAIHNDTLDSWWFRLSHFMQSHNGLDIDDDLLFPRLDAIRFQPCSGFVMKWASNGGTIESRLSDKKQWGQRLRNLLPTILTFQRPEQLSILLFEAFW